MKEFALTKSNFFPFRLAPLKKGLFIMKVNSASIHLCKGKNGGQTMAVYPYSEVSIRCTHEKNTRMACMQKELYSSAAQTTA